MPSHLLRQADFSSGELAPLARGRVDSPAYRTGLRLALNFLPTLEGPLLNRPGTRFVCAVKDSSYAPRLISFNFTDGQNFILEVGDQYIRFVQNGAQVLGPIATGAATWDVGTAYAAGDKALFFVGVPEVPARFTSKVGGNLGHVPPTSGEDVFWKFDSVILEVATPWFIADVPRLDFAQDGDVITVTHPAYEPQDITRLSNIDWTVTPADLTPIAASTFVTNSKVRISNNVRRVAAAVSPDNWDPAKTYAVDDLVLYDAGSGIHLFVAFAVTTGDAPRSDGIGPWSDITFESTDTERQNDYVWLEADTLYISLLSNNDADPPGTSLQYSVATGDTRVATSTLWVVTALWQDANGRRYETLPSNPTQQLHVYVAQDRPATIEWTYLAAGSPNFILLGWKIYRGSSGVYGLVGTLGPETGGGATNGVSFTDKTNVPNFGIQPPKGTNPFDIATGANTKTQSWPGVVTYHEQRRVFARSDKKPQDFFGSAVNNFTNFDINTPIVDSDQYEWRVSSKSLAEIRHLIPLRYLLVLSSSGVFGGYGPAGAIGPNGINLRPYNQPGASYLAPLQVENGAVYQTKKNRIRDLIWDWQVDGYVGRDLSLIGRHLFDGGRSIVDMTYAETPFSLIYAPRSDGVLLTLTYSPNGQHGWARQTTQGKYERVASCEEADPDTGVIEDAVYTVTQRPLPAGALRYIERFSSRLLPTIDVDSEDEDGNPIVVTVDDLRFGNFLDCSVEYDGRNTVDTGDTEFGITNLVGAQPGQQVTIGAVSGLFTVADIGKCIVFDPDGALSGPYVYRIVGIDDPAGSIPLVEPQGNYTTIGSDFPSGSTSNWGLAITNIAGLDHLEGLTVSVLADGGVDGPFVVQGGKVTLSDPATIVQVGLPYVSDAETLDIPQEAVRTNTKTVKSVTLDVVASRGIYVGQDFRKKNLVSPPQLKVKDVKADKAPPPVTGLLDTNIPSGFTVGGRCCVRQVDPLPLSIVGVIRDVLVEGR